MKQREIKYRRAYFKDEAKTQFAHFAIWGVKIDDREAVWPGSNNRAMYYTDQQFTGLHDKNGKEIYEGDIVKPSHNHISANCVIVWGDSGFALSHSNWTNQFAKHVWDEVEVIGNIYENPDLLTPSPNPKGTI